MSIMKNEKTVGQEAYDRLLNPDTKQGIIDTQREIDKEYMTEIDQCIKDNKQFDDPWYIVVQLKKEILMENVMRRYFIARESLPTPQWDQTVWRYEPKTGDLIFCWVLPDEGSGAWMAQYPMQAYENYPDLVRYVNAFLDKKLLPAFLEKYPDKEAPQLVFDNDL